MNTEASSYYDFRKDIFGLPQKYRGVLIYPLCIKDYEYFDLLCKILTFPKKSMDITDPKIFKLTYLKFLFEYILRSEIFGGDFEKSIELLSKFFKKITHANTVELIVNPVGDKNYTISLKIDNTNFSEYEFSALREIILEMNGFTIESVEDFNPDLEQYLDHYNRHSLSLNYADQIFFLASLYGKTIKEIEDITLYQLKRLIYFKQNLNQYYMHYVDLVNAGKEYEIPALVKSYKEPGRYDSILQGVDEFKQKTSYEISN